MTIKILKNPSEEEIISNIKLQIPFKVIGLMDNWKCLNKWNINYFRDNFGNTEVNVKDLQFSEIFVSKKMKLSDYLNYCEDKNDKSLHYASDIMIKDLSSDLFDDYNLDLIDKLDIFRKMGTKHKKGFLGEFRWIFIGKEKTFTGLHSDVANTSGWLGLVSGKKRFYIFDMEETKKIDEYEIYNGVNLLELDELGISRFSELNPLVVDINPGEVIFTPSKVYHFVINLENSIAITENFSFKEIESQILYNYFENGEILGMIIFLYHSYETFTIMLILISLLLIVSKLKNFFYNS